MEPTRLLLDQFKAIVSVIEEYTGAAVKRFNYERRLPESNKDTLHYVTMEMAWGKVMKMPDMNGKKKKDSEVMPAADSSGFTAEDSEVMPAEDSSGFTEVIPAEDSSVFITEDSEVTPAENNEKSNKK